MSSVCRRCLTRVLVASLSSRLKRVLGCFTLHSPSGVVCLRIVYLCTKYTFAFSIIVYPTWMRPGSTVCWLQYLVEKVAVQCCFLQLACARNIKPSVRERPPQHCRGRFSPRVYSFITGCPREQALRKNLTRSVLFVHMLYLGTLMSI